MSKTTQAPFDVSKNFTFSPSPLGLFLQKVSRLEEQEKEVVSALRYFKTIVDKMVVEKKVLEMLPGSASKVLEAILPLVQGEARIQHRWVTPVWNHPLFDTAAISALSTFDSVLLLLFTSIRWLNIMEAVDFHQRYTLVVAVFLQSLTFTNPPPFVIAVILAWWCCSKAASAREMLDPAWCCRPLVSRPQQSLHSSSFFSPSNAQSPLFPLSSLQP